jgi:hypothetical protein
MDLQREKARAYQHYMGWREGQHPCFFRSQEKSFFLTLPLIERGYRTSRTGQKIMGRCPVELSDIGENLRKQNRPVASNLGMKSLVGSPQN